MVAPKICSHNIHRKPTTITTKCRNLSLGLATKARACKVAGQEEA